MWCSVIHSVEREIEMSFHISAVQRRLISLCMVVITAMLLVHNPTNAASPAPKAYVGLFKDNAVAVIDTGTNTVLSTIPVPAGPHGLVITPDGKTVYVSIDGDSKVSVIDTATDKVVNTIEVGKTPHGLAITPDGRQVLVGVFGLDKLAIIDVATNTVTTQLSVPKPHNIAISPDGHTAYVASQMTGAFGLVIFNLIDKAQVGMISLDKAPRALSFSPDGKQLYFTQAGIDAVQVLNPATNTIVTQIAVGASPHHPWFTAEYGLVVSQTTNELAILDSANNTVKATIPVGKMPHWIATSADGDTAYVTDEGSDEVSVVNLETQKVTATIPVGHAPRKIVIQPAAGAAGAATMAATPAATAAQQ